MSVPGEASLSRTPATDELLRGWRNREDSEGDRVGSLVVVVLVAVVEGDWDWFDCLEVCRRKKGRAMREKRAMPGR